jgi:putative oxidoreductase
MSPQARHDTALVALRGVFGLVILTHGVPKLLHLPHGSMGDPFAATTRLIAATVGPAFAVPLAWAVTLLETAGAVLVVTGVLTRLVALAFVAEMVGICVAMGPAWAWIDRGIEYPVVLGAIAAFLVACGPGRWSLRRAPRSPSA